MNEISPLMRFEEAQRELNCLSAVLEAVGEMPRPDLVVEHAARETFRIAGELQKVIDEMFAERRAERGREELESAFDELELDEEEYAE